MIKGEVNKKTMKDFVFISFGLVLLPVNKATCLGSKEI